MDTTKLKGAAFLFGAFTLAGTSVVCARIVSDHLGTFTITVLSMAFGLLFLLPICGKKLTRELCAMSRGGWLRMVMQAVFGIFLFRFLLITGLKTTSAAEAGILTGANARHHSYARVGAAQRTLQCIFLRGNRSHGMRRTADTGIVLTRVCAVGQSFLG